mgnify:FL=1
MYRSKHLVFILCFFLLLCGCSKKDNRSDTPDFQNTTANITASDTDGVSSDSTTEPSVTSSTTTDKSELGNSSVPTEIEKQPQSEASAAQMPISSTTLPTTSTAPAETTTTNPSELIHIKSISVSLSGYYSTNESKPYIKSNPIYQVLYNGSRAQVGDTLTFNVSIYPVSNNGKISIKSSENLSATLSGNTLSVKIKGAGQYGTGLVTIYGLDPDGKKIDAESTVNLVIDKSENPFNNLSTVLSDYIRAKNMEYTTVLNGYTKDDPALSITAYPGAPAWDDCIYKSDSNYISRCFWLIDEYASLGFKKINFIITGEQIGFAASK